MKKIAYLTFIVFVLSFSGCRSTFYYARVFTFDTDLIQEENGVFIVENGIVDIVYNFCGQDLYLDLSLFNNTEQSVFLSKSSSFIVTGDKCLDFNGNKLPVNKDSISCAILVADSMDYFSDAFCILPESDINHRIFIDNKFPFEKIKDKEYTSHKMFTDQDKIGFVESKYFLIENSPYSFKTLLTFYTMQDDGSRGESWQVCNHFYTSEIIKTKSIRPDEMNYNYQEKGDVFYIEKYSKTATFLGTVGLVTGSILYLLFAVVEDE